MWRSTESAQQVWEDNFEKRKWTVTNQWNIDAAFTIIKASQTILWRINLHQNNLSHHLTLDKSALSGSWSNDGSLEFRDAAEFKGDRAADADFGDKADAADAVDFGDNAAAAGDVKGDDAWTALATIAASLTG